MSRMDEENQPECDVYVEDEASGELVKEAMIAIDHDLVPRVQIVPFGAASVGLSLGIMIKQKRFPRLSVAFLDGDQDSSDGVFVLPGEDAPERVVFEGLKSKNWPDISGRIGRSPSTVIDILNKAMTLSNHHDWVKTSADVLFIGSSHLWQAMCAAWIAHCATATNTPIS